MMTFASDRDTCRVIVGDVADDWTLVYDYKTGNERRVPTSSPGGLMPLTGDVWSICKGNGIWMLESCISRNVDSHQRSLAEVLDMLDRIGLIRWRPDEGDDVFSRHGYGYIGEIRQFDNAVNPDGWLACDGSLQLIARYRRLFRAIGVSHGGNGTTNFALPDLSSYAVAGREAELVYGTEWAAYGGFASQMCKTGRNVTVVALARNMSGAAVALPSVLATIPAAFRPDANIMSSVHSSNAIHTRVDLNAAGTITAIGPTQSIASLGWVQIQFSYMTAAALDPQPGSWLICAD
jgi:microcystin-dependent protein